MVLFQQSHKVCHHLFGRARQTTLTTQPLLTHRIDTLTACSFGGNQDLRLSHAHTRSMVCTYISSAAWKLWPHPTPPHAWRSSTYIHSVTWMFLLHPKPAWRSSPYIMQRNMNVLALPHAIPHETVKKNGKNTKAHGHLQAVVCWNKPQACRKATQFPPNSD